MDHIEEDEDWCQINRTDFVKDDCLFSSLPSSTTTTTTNDLHYTDCCNTCDEAHYLLQSNTTTTEYGIDSGVISLDGVNMSLGTLEEQLNLASNLFDVKIELNNNCPNVSETSALNSSHFSSLSELESNGIFRSSFTTGQSFLKETAYSKTRRKMHEMAVKQKLITEQDPKSCGFLHLSSEEKRALLQEGYKLPTMLPLTKSEEDTLKLSAQESRRKRKEYMDALEKRIHYYRTENSTLKLKLKDLEQRNRSLFIELRNFKISIASNHMMEHHPSCPAPNVTIIK